MQLFFGNSHVSRYSRGKVHLQFTIGFYNNLGKHINTNCEQDLKYAMLNKNSLAVNETHIIQGGTYAFEI